jgi:hypothetical protein
MSDTEDQHDEEIVFDSADEVVRAYSIFPKFPKPRAVQSLSKTARIAYVVDSFVKELQNAGAVLRVELTEFPVGLGRKLNLPRHDAS